MSGFYSIPFAGPLAEWIAIAHEHAKKAGKESGQELLQYSGYIVLDDVGQLKAFALVDARYAESVPDLSALARQLEASREFNDRQADADFTGISRASERAA